MGKADVIALDDHRPDDEGGRNQRAVPRRVRARTTSQRQDGPSEEQVAAENGRQRAASVPDDSTVGQGGQGRGRGSQDHPDHDRRVHDHPEDDQGTTAAPPSDQPPGAELGRLLTELATAGQRLLAGLGELPNTRLRELADDPLRTAIDLAGRLGVDWTASSEELTEFVRSRMAGDYAVDEFGFDPEFTTTAWLPVLRQLSRRWFRIEVRGAENIPADGAALLVSNHAGVLPIDAMMLQSVIFDESERHARCLGADLIFGTPYSADLARKIGATLACQEDAERLLERGDLVTVFPEGFKGLGKLYTERYQLQRFGRGGFVSAAVRAQVPIVPVSIVGSEEIYPQVAQLPALARMLGVPYFPVTPLFPLLGLIGMIPLPSKWIIQFGEQIATDELPTGAADDPMVVFNVTDQVRETIQQSLYELLTDRGGIFG
ncbi:lysophospholipid acyltransferase family protein [Microlunatus soli]|uniref:1-acyl-sn-glycerol-3-phosphate acyltransferase n=1 Tax=Microlunatus soli TaxID=630515 RepID=A0A1H1SCJ6_9ACTN|nr:lysophospholipid acyltransferase family protein [Microlunatus soli]SDS45593.1 1-acyl-sn-glycerol-3-phosphate acyltransferase [Microlunatus soli]